MNIEQNVSLLPYNTFGIAARAAYFTHLTHEKDIAPLLREPIFQQQTPLILGGGSNLLFTDNFNGLVIKNELKGIEIMEETGLVVKDSNGTLLQNGDSVTIIKNLPVKGSPKDIKVGTKVKNIKLVDGNHNIDCKIEGFGSMALKSEFVRKA
jgi:protein PhnA